MTAERLARPEIRGLRPYVTARQEPESLRLNANEAPLSIRGPSSSLNRYPPIRPRLLEERLARHYGVAPENLLATRGASEAIDLALRVFCRAGIDNVVTTPPTFAMYRVYADIQGAAAVSVPLLPERGFEYDVREVLAACNDNTKLIFVCSPNNPTGGLVSRADVLELVEARKGRSMIVVDEAYVEFSGAESLAPLAAGTENLIVLRTLSKAFALAGVRCGVVVGSEETIRLLSKLLAPYALATPVIDCVLEALAPSSLQAARQSVECIVRERERLSCSLARLPLVKSVWPSRANFLLVRFDDAEGVRRRLRECRILVRDFDGDAGLADCLRITVGSRDDNDRLLGALAAVQPEPA